MSRRGGISVGLTLAWSLLYGIAASAADLAAANRMDEILVTGTRERLLWTAPRSVTVITAEDIARTPAAGLPELLAREANVNLRSFFGNDKFSGVDIRGQGDTFTSNVLMLVDGVRMNAVDLSGADFSSVPLDQIERIEVIRGANAVRYGSGAVGGVINILTRRHEGRPQANARLTAGSFDSYETAASVAAGLHGLSARAMFSAGDSDGHRDNGFFDRRDGALELRFEHAGWLDVQARGALHDDHYGLPGPVSREAFEGSDADRRSTRAPNDHGRTTDRRYRGGVNLDLGAFGTIHALARHRNRTNPFVIGHTPLLTIPDQLSTIESVSRNYEGSWTLPLQLFGYTHELVLGYEEQLADYERREGGRGILDVSRSLVGRVDQRGGFISAHLELPARLSADLGYRRDRFRITRREEALREVCDIDLVDTTVTVTVQVEVFPGFFVPFDVPLTVTLPVETNCRGELQITRGQDERWHNDAWEAALSWQLTDQATTWLSYHRSFRNPSVDELTLAADDLAPQQGIHWEWGLRLRNPGRFEGSLALFRSRTRNEIFFGFDVDSGRDVNFNLDQGTTRRGFELELKLWPRPGLMTWANLSYVDVRLERSNAVMPLVPRNQVAAGFDWQLTRRLSLSSSVNWTGKRYDGNDFDNGAFDKLAAYKVVDARLNWRAGPLRVALVANNLTDEVYSTAAFSQTFYPMPPRSFSVELAFGI